MIFAKAFTLTLLFFIGIFFIEIRSSIKNKSSCGTQFYKNRENEKFPNCADLVRQGIHLN